MDSSKIYCIFTFSNAVTWLKLCQYGEKLYPINQSITFSYSVEKTWKYAKFVIFLTMYLMKKQPMYPLQKCTGVLCFVTRVSTHITPILSKCFLIYITYSFIIYKSNEKPWISPRRSLWYASIKRHFIKQFTL